MVCIHCGGKTRVTNSRLQRRANQIWRRRQCLACKNVFTTEEQIEYQQAWLVESREGHLEPFSRDILLISLHGSLQHRLSAPADAGALADTIIAKLQSHHPAAHLKSSEIARIAQVTLNRFDKAASVHYQAFHK